MVFGLIRCVVTTMLIFFTVVVFRVVLPGRDNNAQTIDLAWLGVDDGEMQVLIVEAIAVAGNIPQLSKSKATNRTLSN